MTARARLNDHRNGDRNGCLTAIIRARASSPDRAKLVELAQKVVYGEVWERPGLSKRDRSLITVATLVALGRERQLHGHLERAVSNGVTKDEIGELIIHLAFYAGGRRR